MVTQASSDASTRLNPLNVDITVQGSGVNEKILKLFPVATWETWFYTWIKFLKVDLSPIHAYELSLQLVNDSDIRRLNAIYRQKDYPTDVLAFAALATQTPQPAELWSAFPVCLGDIVISIETAQRQAQQQKCSLKHELTWLAAHGLLHLLGWDHPDDESLTKMLNKQTQLLYKINLN